MTPRYNNCILREEVHELGPRSLRCKAILREEVHELGTRSLRCKALGDELSVCGDYYLFSNNKNMYKKLTTQQTNAVIKYCLITN